MAKKSEKKVVRVESTAESKAAAAENASDWTPTPEAKSKATTLRIIALVLWALAIAGEVVAIFWLLVPYMQEVQFPDWALWALIGAAVVIGILALVGSMLWKKANRLDPASKKNGFKFFVQNQLGVIITIIAFLPLIILIFTNKNMDGKQKGIAGGIAIAVMVAVGLLSADFNPPSVEETSAQTAEVIALKGVDEVAWVSGGSVYHLCADVSDVNRQSADNTIFTGTVAEAIAAGKTRLTLKIDQNLEQCGLPPRGELEVPETE